MAKAMKLHLARVRRYASGAVRITSDCGFLLRTCADGMNVTNNHADVTCKFCLRTMEKQSAALSRATGETTERV